MKGHSYSLSVRYHNCKQQHLQVQYASFHPRPSNNIPDILRSDATSEFAHSKLAELQILDSMTFDEVLSRCLEGEIKTRLCQNFLLQFLLRNCQQILDQPDMKAKRRATIIRGNSSRITLFTCFTFRDQIRSLFDGTVLLTITIVNLKQFQSHVETQTSAQVRDKLRKAEVYNLARRIISY